MDIDKNGYLVSEEVERFRMTYRDYPAGEKPAASPDDKERGLSSNGHHGRGHGSGNSSGDGGGNNSGVIDPVMSADTNLDYKVTPDEFMAYSKNIFENIDTDHAGKLNQAEVTAAMCGPKP